MELKSHIPKTEAWKNRRAGEIENLFWMHSPGVGQEVDVHELGEEDGIPLGLLAIEEEMGLLGLDPEQVEEVREMVGDVIRQGSTFGRQKLLISYGDGEIGPSVVYL